MPELTRALVETVNHHVRTPLTVISGHVEMWSDRIEEFPSEVQESFAVVLQAGRRLADVGVAICDLVGAACLDPAAVARVDLEELAAGQAASWRDRARQRGLRLVLDCHRGAELVADPGRLRRALDALLENALEHAPERSTVWVDTSINGSSVRITVSDEGAGIDAAERARLVRPFERGSHPMQPGTGLGTGFGTGLGTGLAVASAVAESHGGRLILSDRPGGGLSACLELPVDLDELGRVRPSPSTG